MNIYLHERFAALPARGPADELTWRDGCLRDYGALAAFHYLRHRPAGAKRVLVLADCRPTVVGRFAQRRAEQRVVGVLVESLPALGCVLRNVATGGRYAGWSDRRASARLLNAEVRCISRVVVHPQWRGLGLAVRLVGRALATMTTPYTEALAAMGRVHPLFRLAGMREYRRPPLGRDQRLVDALASAGLAPWALAATRSVRRWLAGEGEAVSGIVGGADGGGLIPARDGPRRRATMTGPGVDAGEAMRELVRDELGRWAGRRLPLDEQLARARDRLLCEPVYYLKRRP
jgi:hypothetical protein